MNLVLSKEQRYISKVDHINYQAWQIEDVYNTGNTFITNEGNMITPDIFSYNLYVQDVIDNKYSEYRLETKVVYDGLLRDWLILPLDRLNTQLTSNNVVINFDATYNFLNVLEGLHNAKVIFKIYGKANSIEKEITSYTYTFNFKVFPLNHYYSPLFLEVVNSSSVKDKPSIIVTGEFEIATPSGILLWFRGESYSYYKGSGFHQFVVEVDNTVNNSEVSKLITIKYDNATYTVLVNSFIYTDYSPKHIVFNASAGVIDKPTQKVYFEEKGDYTLTHPQWLEVKKINTQPRYLQLFLPSVDNFGSGEFNQPIIMQFADRKITIPVTLNIFDGFNLGLKSGEIMFAESTPLLELFSNSISNHLEIDVILDDEETNLFNFKYKLPFFQKKAEFSISEILRRQVILKDYFIKDFTKKELPILSLVIREVQGENVLKEYLKTNIPVLNGSRPSKMFDKMAILNMDILERFTPRGVAVVNVLSPGIFSYSIRINSEVVEKIEKATGVIRSIYIDFSKLKVNEGDMVEFVLHTAKGDVTKAFIITQLTAHSTVVYYRNKHGLISSIELTGELKIDTEKKRKLEKYSTNGEFKTRSYLEDSQDKMAINTGYVFIDQIELVNELLESNQAFFYQSEDRFMIIPTSEKITKLDTNTFLNSVQLEFIINDIHYAQVYFQQ